MPAITSISVHRPGAEIHRFFRGVLAPSPSVAVAVNQSPFVAVTERIAAAGFGGGGEERIGDGGLDGYSVGGVVVGGGDWVGGRICGG